MNMPNDRSSHPSSESGQAAVLVAFLLFMVFLALAALTIDGAMSYLVRRDTQNVADSAALAACRVIANNDTSGGTVETTAMNAANEIAVDAFLNGGIRFVEIADVIRSTMDAHAHRDIDGLDDALEADRWAREKAESLVHALPR